MWEEATRLGWQLGREGWNLPAQDIVIAACARRIGAAVLTYDKHFDAIADLRVLRSLDELE
jgi:predicted nucleic acid-binding protein